MRYCLKQNKQKTNLHVNQSLLYGAQCPLDKTDINIIPLLDAGDGTDVPESQEKKQKTESMREK